jgi:hypothetical protein
MWVYLVLDMYLDMGLIDFGGGIVLDQASLFFCYNTLVANYYNIKFGVSAKVQ